MLKKHGVGMFAYSTTKDFVGVLTPPEISSVISHT